MNVTKAKAAARRGLEAGILAMLGYLAAKYLATDPHTASGLVDTVRDNLDEAVGAGITTALLSAGLVASPIKNPSPVAELAPAPAVDPDTDDGTGAEGEQVA